MEIQICQPTQNLQNNPNYFALNTAQLYLGNLLKELGAPCPDEDPHQQIDKKLAFFFQNHWPSCMAMFKPQNEIQNTSFECEVS